MTAWVYYPGCRARIVEEVGQDLPLQHVAPPRRNQQIENAIASGVIGMHAGMMDLGKPSKYTCPECNGVLVQIEEGRLVRFRCHTGHAYSFQALLAEINGTVDTGLWSTVRAIEERILLLRQLADRAAGHGRDEEAARLRARADKADAKCRPLRDLMLDDDFFAED
jgi:two-component system chemotaxis response regulator CheB